MIFHFNQEEINKAIKYYLQANHTGLQHSIFDFSYIARRKGKGIEATITAEGLDIPGLTVDVEEEQDPNTDDLNKEIDQGMLYREFEDDKIISLETEKTVSNTVFDDIQEPTIFKTKTIFG